MGRAGGWVGLGGKGRKLYLNNNKIKRKNIYKEMIAQKTELCLIFEDLIEIWKIEGLLSFHSIEYL